MKLVVPKTDPGIDGCATAVAYAELLKPEDDEEDGERATAAAFGTPDQLSRNVMEHIDEEMSDASYYIYNADGFIVVDASHPRQISNRIRPDLVEEVIDNDTGEFEQDLFENAESELADVGATATIVTERYQEAEEEPSEDAATLLQIAILQETDALQEDSTTSRDEEAVEYLEDLVELPDELVGDIDAPVEPEDK